MLHYSRYRAWFCLFLVLLMTLVQPLAVFADVMTPTNAFLVNPDYLIGSSSNADSYGISTMELSDGDYYIQPFSSIGTVNNTVNESFVRIFYTNGTYTNSSYITPTLSDGRFSFSFKMPESMDGYYVSNFYVYLDSMYTDVHGLPSAGNYNISFDYASNFSFNKNEIWYDIRSDYLRENAERLTVVTPIPSLDVSSGDIYMPPFAINIGSKYEFFYLRFGFNYPTLTAFSGNYAVNFSMTSTQGAETAGGSYSDIDYESDVSGSLSDISSSIGDMSESLDSAAENLEYISTSQNLIIQGIDNVIMHISDQLYAFWDQLYNLIHEPTYARLGDILDAIRNLDLEITVEMTEVTNAVNKMNQDMQNKLQNVQQTITQGFDNSVMESEASKLDDSISEYDEAEQSVIQNVNESLNDFEFDAELGEYQSIVSVVSDFLQQLYVSSGGFKVLINLSMLLSLAGIVIGIYRFGGGS